MEVPKYISAPQWREWEYKRLSGKEEKHSQKVH